MSHKKIFANFIKELNDNQVNYLIIRGFSKLPDKPDSDIDLVCHRSDWDIFNKIASKHLSKDPKEPFENYGFAEYCDMLYHPYFTPGPKQPDISNGCFRIDSYNSIYFSSPFNNFKTFWTISNDISEKIFSEKKKISTTDYDFFTPNNIHELILLLLRSLLDIMGWKKQECKQKHKNRISNLLPKCNQEKLKEDLSKVLVSPDYIIECIKKDNYKDLYNKIIGDFNDGVNRR
jgi:hypothetical protein